ncbi:MAG TPA: efflux RND transporter periplasmic adaptor subunit, partial [Phycisphaerae bacterium]|nr:efflux RND transporter periplasmic adaptor subunit [Phycisphaerae bacterium]
AGVYYYMHPPKRALVLTGIVTTDTSLVASQVQGRLRELRVKQGDVVKKGDVVAIIDPGVWQADTRYFESTQRVAATQVSQAQADLQFMESQTKNQIAQAQAAADAADADVVASQAELENARLSFRRAEAAYKTGAETAQEFDQARLSYEAQKSKVEALQKQATAAKAAIALAKSNLEQVEMRKAALQASEHQLAAAGAQVDKAQVQLQYTKIEAPIDGVVDVRARREGEVVDPGQAIVTLINPDDLWIRMDVEETYIDGIHMGDKLPVRLASGREIEGTVFYRAVDADYATQRDVSRTKRDIKTFEVRLRCDNRERILAVGMTAYVTLPVEKQYGGDRPAGTMTDSAPAGAKP